MSERPADNGSAGKTVDTRVVEAKFDSKQFEQGIDRTVKKLDELKKSLNLKDSEKSIADIGEKISETSEKASSSLEKLQDRFTSFTGMLKQKLISGIADEIVGGIFRITNSINGLIKSLTTGQIGYGMQRYTDILTSVRTLVSAGTSEEASYEVIERLGLYADQTSYSLDSLVSTMSKFKTAGASLATAQRMVEGLSNAAASMGVNAQQAERAYLNLQQAYSKGVMLQNDWISFESIPMVGEKFNQAILDAAVKVGTLQKDKKTGQYKTKKKAGSQVKTTGADAKGITAENLGTKLSSRWFTKEVMEEVFGNTYYFSEVGIDEVRKIKNDLKDYKQALKSGEMTQDEYNNKLDEYFSGMTKEKYAEKQADIARRQKEINLQYEQGTLKEDAYKKKTAELTAELKDLDKAIHLTRVGWESFTAGQEARSFTDVLNTLKDYISRGWAKSFELIFGKLDEAKEFFTDLSEGKIATAIYDIVDFRNSVLENWNADGGRNSMIEFFKTLEDIIQDVLDSFNLFPDSVNDLGFDQSTYDNILKNGGYDAAERYKNSMYETVSFAERLGDRLATITRNLTLKIQHFREWLNQPFEGGETRIDKITKII